MADLLQNFAYCALTGTINNSVTSLPVDECSRLPSNAQLSANNFWMTIESSYAAAAFEIVKVTAKSATSGPGNLTVVRGQESTAAVGHSTGTYLKATLTAGIMGRLGSARTTGTYTTASLGAGGVETGLITLSLTFLLLAIQTSAPARVRLYETAAYRTADASRPVGVDPAVSGSGVILDYLTTSGALSATLSPIPVGSNMESSPSTSIPLSITATGAGTVTLTLTYLRTE